MRLVGLSVGVLNSCARSWKRLNWLNEEKGRNEKGGDVHHRSRPIYLILVVLQTDNER